MSLLTPPGPRTRTDPTGGLRIGFFGVLGSGNIGNDGSLDGLITYLREHHPEMRFRFLAMGPERLQERYGAPATHLQWYEANAVRLRVVPAPLLKIVGRVLDPFRALRWTREIDVAIVPGMGILESTVPIRPWGFPYGLFAVCAAARISGVEVGMVCVGATGIRQRLTRLLVTRAARMAHYRSYRDRNSLRAMREMGVDVGADQVYPDLAFGHQIPSTVPDGTRTVALGLMDYRGNNDERGEADRLHAAYIGTMTRFAGWLLDRGRPVRFLICDPEDELAIVRVIDDLRAERPGLSPDMIVFEPAETIQELREQMVGVDAVVATRYHNVVGAVQMNLPTISVSYSAKHDEVMAGVGLGAFRQSARSVDFDLLVHQFTELERRAEEFQASMTAANQRNREGVGRQLAALSAFLTGVDNPAEVASRP